MSLSSTNSTNFLDVVYQTLFQPAPLFRDVAESESGKNALFLYGLLVVAFVSAIVPVIDFTYIGGNPYFLFLTIPVQAMLGVMIWLVTGVIISMLSYVFTGESRLKTFLILSGLAMLPWILIGPAALLKPLGAPGALLSILSILGIWLWSILLFAMAVMATFRLTLEKGMLVLMTPFLMLFIFGVWTAGFFLNLARLLPN